MNSIQLTKRGKEILSTNTLNGGQKYWVGYFGLAYVPEQDYKIDEDTTLVGKDETGDYIYNIWQGDLVNEGHAIAADNFSRLTLYDRNLTSNFRYVYDKEKCRNQLVTWTTDNNELGDVNSETQSYSRTGYTVYTGITLGDSHAADDVQEGEFTGLPCPAPLFYAGSCKYAPPAATPEDMMTTIGKDWPVSDGYPFVTPDMRFYSGTIGETGTTWEWAPDATQYDTLPAEYTREDIGSPDVQAMTLDQYAKYVSVSNFNKEHGHVSAEGYGIGIQESCHNMCTVTKLFPIGSYEIKETEEPATVDPNYSERGSAKSIKYNLRLNLRGAYQSVQKYLDTIEYYGPAADSSSEQGTASTDELFTEKKPNSFKFNRIGIYAIPVAIRHFYKEGDAANRSDCRATHYQIEVSPDAIPELFAVISLDEQCMSEDGSFGLSDFNMNFVLNLEGAPDSGDLCTNPEVYYNLVENEAITWYQNQLLATAGLSEAVTNLGVNVAHVMNTLDRYSGSRCAVSGSGVTNIINNYGTGGGSGSGGFGAAQIIDWNGNETDDSAAAVWTRAQEILGNDLLPVLGTTTSNGYMRLMPLVRISSVCSLYFYDTVDSKYFIVNNGDPFTWSNEWKNVGKIFYVKGQTEISPDEFQQVKQSIENGYFPKLYMVNSSGHGNTEYFTGDLVRYVTDNHDAITTIEWNVIHYSSSPSGNVKLGVSLSNTGSWSYWDITT